MVRPIRQHCVRPAQEADLPAIVALDEASFTSASAWSHEDYAQSMRRPDHWLALADAGDGCATGFFAASVVLDEAELLKIATSPSRRGEGIGAALLAAFIDTCRTHRVHTVHLEVKTSNAPAIQLYRKFTFQPCGLRPRYYSDGTDALLMSCTLD